MTEEDPGDRIEAPARRHAFWVAGAGMVAALATAVDQGWPWGLFVAGIALALAAGGYAINLLHAMFVGRGRRVVQPDGMPELPPRE